MGRETQEAGQINQNEAEDDEKIENRNPKFNQKTKNEKAMHSKPSTQTPEVISGGSLIPQSGRRISPAFLNSLFNFQACGQDRPLLVSPLAWPFNARLFQFQIKVVW